MNSSLANRCPVGDMAWASELTGWSNYKIARLARQGIFVGAYKARRGVRGDVWSFNKRKSEAWFQEITK